MQQLASTTTRKYQHRANSFHIIIITELTTYSNYQICIVIAGTVDDWYLLSCHVILTRFRVHFYPTYNLLAV